MWFVGVCRHLPAVTIRGVAEVALFVKDVARSRDFYATVLGLEILRADDRGSVLRLAADQVLLLIRQGEPRELETPGGTIPACDARGSMHVAFSVEDDDLTAWKRRLGDGGVEVSEVDWRRAGVGDTDGSSLFFRDPDGHLIELLGDVRGLWGLG